MKKVFNTSLLAASLAMAFSANAADLRPASGADQLSAQGIAVGVTSTDTLDFDVTVRNVHPSQSEITLTFSQTVDLTGVNSTTVNSNDGDFTDVQFDYGNGVFTFDDVVVDEDAGTITFTVATGNPIAAASSFNVQISGAEVSGAASVDYLAEFFGDEVETGTGTIATTANQFSVTALTEFDRRIERENRLEFVGANKDTDSISFVYEDKSGDLSAAATPVSNVITLDGDFTGLNAVAGWSLQDVAACDASGVVDVAAAAVGTADAQIEFELTTLSAGETTLYVCYETAGTGVLAESNFEISSVVTFSDGATEEDTVTLVNGADAGQWRLDASVVNVPYLPINYGYTPNVEIANQGNTSGEIIVEAIDNTSGEAIDARTLVHRHTGEPIMTRADGLVTVTEGDLVRSLGLGSDRVKVSVTFIIDADEDDITLAPYYRQGESRINVLTDQYKK